MPFCISSQVQSWAIFDNNSIILNPSFEGYLKKPYMKGKQVYKIDLRTDHTAAARGGSTQIQ